MKNSSHSQSQTNKVKKDNWINRIKDELGQSVHVTGRNRTTEGVEYTMELKVRFNDIQRQYGYKDLRKTELIILMYKKYGGEKNILIRRCSRDGSRG